jgi:hypothetical protein
MISTSVGRRKSSAVSRPSPPVPDFTAELDNQAAADAPQRPGSKRIANGLSRWGDGALNIHTESDCSGTSATAAARAISGGGAPLAGAGVNGARPAGGPTWAR